MLSNPAAAAQPLKESITIGAQYDLEPLTLAHFRNDYGSCLYCPGKLDEAAKTIQEQLKYSPSKKDFLQWQGYVVCRATALTILSLIYQDQGKTQLSAEVSKEAESIIVNELPAHQKELADLKIIRERLIRQKARHKANCRLPIGKYMAD